MATEVVMPQMGESIAEGTITRWLVKVGERVERDQPLFEISTDKVDAEIPSPAAGTLVEIKYEEGATVPVNEIVALIGEAGAVPAVGGIEAKTIAVPASEPPPATSQPPAEAPDRRVEASPPIPAAHLLTPGEESLEERIRRTSSPVVRKIAAAEAVDISTLEGTGIHGRVTKKDIEAHLEQRGQAPAPAPTAVPAPAPAPAPAPTSAPARPATGFHVPAYTEGELVTIEPMSKIRQITAAHMRYSKDTSAHVTTLFHFDMSAVHRARERAKQGFLAANGTKLSYMPFIFKAVAGALRRHKKLNAAIDGTNVVYKGNVNLGMAVAMDRGLIVPVLKNADQLSLVGLARTANDLAERARSKKLLPEDIQGGTFTITNPGVFGSLFGTPIINQPQVAILGIGAIEKRPVVVADEHGNDMIAIKTMSYFAITYDHRLVDGADADHFMNDVKKTLETDSWGELAAYT